MEIKLWIKITFNKNSVYFEVKIPLCIVNTRHLKPVVPKSRRKKETWNIHFTPSSSLAPRLLWMSTVDLYTMGQKTFWNLTYIFTIRYLGHPAEFYQSVTKDQKPTDLNTCCCCRNLKREEARLPLLFLNNEQQQKNNKFSIILILLLV